jgi:toxin ParE1/3/4
VRVRWTPDAERDRINIRRYIAKENRRAATRIDLLFTQAAARLAEFPSLGRSGRVAGTRELHVHRSYRLVYKVVDDTVWVVNLVHTARQWPPAWD